MDKEVGIKFGVFDGFTWIRCEGKGSFLQSPALKECANARRDEGEKHFVIDLEACTGMDSTFMGFLAGLASRVGRDNGWVQIARPGERNRQSLEDLGLDCLLEISPADAPWQEKVDGIREDLKPYAPKRLPSMSERARHVLDAHKELAATSEENTKRFANVMQVLENQVSEKSDADD